MVRPGLLSQESKATKASSRKVGGFFNMHKKQDLSKRTGLIKSGGAGGIWETEVLVPSSCHQAIVHRTLAFDDSNPMDF